MFTNNGRSFVTIMIVTALIAVALRIGLERVVKFSIAQNESNASATVKLISAALESYAHDHLGAFPVDTSVLTKENPRYLDRDYISESPMKGYEYVCERMDSAGYSCMAAPVKCNLSGRISYTVTTGGLMSSEECNKKE